MSDTPSSVEDEYLRQPDPFRVSLIPPAVTGEPFTDSINITNSKKTATELSRMLGVLGQSGQEWTAGTTWYLPCAQVAELNQSGELKIFYAKPESGNSMQWGVFDVVGEGGSKSGQALAILLPPDFVRNSVDYQSLVPQIVDAVMFSFEDNHRYSPAGFLHGDLRPGERLIPVPGQTYEFNREPKVSPEPEKPKNPLDMARDLFNRRNEAFVNQLLETPGMEEIRLVLRPPVAVEIPGVIPPPKTEMTVEQIYKKQQLEEAESKKSPYQLVVNGQIYSQDQGPVIFARSENNIQLTPDDWQSGSPNLVVSRFESVDREGLRHELFFVDAISREVLPDGTELTRIENYEDGKLVREMRYARVASQPDSDGKVVVRQIHTIIDHGYGKYNTLVYGILEPNGSFDLKTQYYYQNYIAHDGPDVMHIDMQSLVDTNAAQPEAQKFIAQYGPLILDHDVQFDIPPAKAVLAKAVAASRNVFTRQSQQ